jgi:anti-sigma B factor antagonist
MGHKIWEHGPRGDCDADADNLLRITRRRFTATVVVFVAGDIDLTTAAHLADVLRAELGSHPGTIVLDLTDVEFMGSIGIAVLAEADQAAGASGQRLRVVVSEGHAVRRSLTMSGMAERLSVFGDLDDAIANV